MTHDKAQSFSNNGENSRTFERKERSKRELIIQYYLNNPQMQANQIAEKARTSVGYVWNVLSKYKKGVSSERWGSNRSYGMRGVYFYEDAVLPEWYDQLKAPIVNSRTGMKQIGIKKNGDPCSLQIHRNGRVIIFDHSLGWKEWLVDQLMVFGWDDNQSRLLVDNCKLTLKVIEEGIKVPEGYLPKDLMVKTAWGFVLVKDDSPTKNTLEIKISIPNMEQYLGLPKIKKDLQLLIKNEITQTLFLKSIADLLRKTQKEATK